MSEPPPSARYRTADEDSARWRGFPFRAGDIVISTRSKHGTTWVQAICALLVHPVAGLPAPLPALSPWLDWLGEPRADVLARLEAQPHRRIIKTHTPLDGVPRAPGVTYVVVARDPLDAAVSLWHQGANLDRARMAALTGEPAAAAPRERKPLADWLRAWIDDRGSGSGSGGEGGGADGRPDLDSLPGVFHHLADAWSRRGDPAVVLVRYDDLTGHLAVEMRRIAGRLGIDVPEAAWPALVEAAGFEGMRGRAEVLAPDHGGILRDRAAFFRRGRPGAAREILTPADLRRYADRAATLAPPDLLAWLHPDPNSVASDRT